MVSSNARVVVKTNTTVEELIKTLSTLPKDAKVSIFKTKYYDQRDPGEEGLSLTWRTEL